MTEFTTVHNRTTSPASARSKVASPTGPTSPFSGPAPILAAAVLWGTTGTASTFAPSGAPAAAIGSSGLALGGLLLFFTSRSARSLPGSLAHEDRRLILLGALAVFGYPVTFYPAVARSGVAVATVVALGSAPVFAGLLAWLTSRTRPTVRWSLATVTETVGCVLLVFGPELGGDGTARIDIAGVALAALSGLSYSAYALAGERLIARGQPSSAVIGMMFGAAAPLVLPVLLATGTRWLATVRGAAVAGYLALVTTFVAYRLFGRGLRYTAAQTATTLTLAEPAVATLLGSVVLGERLSAVSWLGLAGVAVGLAVMASADIRRRRN
jgi:DME family drug/metabolite transporter